jgi:hypothetical protein
MEGRTSGRTQRETRETAAPYGSKPVEKLSISLPPGLAARARHEAQHDGSSVSAVVAAALRERFERLDQSTLDAVLDADRDESVRAAEALLPYAAALFAETEW